MIVGFFVEEIAVAVVTMKASAIMHMYFVMHMIIYVKVAIQGGFAFLDVNQHLAKMEIISPKRLFVGSVIVVSYLILLYLGNHYEYDFGYLQILLEVFTIPVVLIQFLILALVIVQILKKNHSYYNWISSLFGN